MVTYNGPVRAQWSIVAFVTLSENNGRYVFHLWQVLPEVETYHHTTHSLSEPDGPLFLSPVASVTRGCK